MPLEGLRPGLNTATILQWQLGANLHIVTSAEAIPLVGTGPQPPGQLGERHQQRILQQSESSCPPAGLF